MYPIYFKLYACFMVGHPDLLTSFRNNYPYVTSIPDDNPVLDFDSLNLLRIEVVFVTDAQL